MLSDKVKDSLICFLVFYLIIDWGAAMVIYGKQPHLMANVVKHLKNTKFLAVVAFAVLACVLLHRYVLSSADETADDSNLLQEEEMQTLMESPEHYYNYEEPPEGADAMEDMDATSSPDDTDADDTAPVDNDETAVAGAAGGDEFTDYAPF